MNYFQYVLLGISFLSIYSAFFYTLFFFIEKDKLNNENKTKKKQRVSIISSMYNEEKNIEKWITSLLEQDYPLDIYIVDDNSTDKTPEICKKYAKQGLITFIQNKENKGKVPNINFLLKNHVKTELFCVLDGDCFYEKGAVEDMAKHFNDKKVGSVIPTTKISGARNLLERVQAVEYYLSSFLRPISSLFGGVYTTNGLTMFRTKAVREAGYFDESTLTEDMDMCMRLYANGYKIKGDSKPHACTYPERTIKDYLKQRKRWQTGFVDNFISHYPTIKKHPGMVYVTFPLAFAWVSIITGLFARVVYHSTNSTFRLSRTLRMINYDIMFYLNQMYSNFYVIRLNIVNVTFFTSTVIFFALLVFAISKVENREKLKTVLNVPIYILTYSILLTLTWLATYGYILKNKGRRVGWTHQT